MLAHMQTAETQRDGSRPTWRLLLLVAMLLLSVVLVAREAGEAATLFTEHGPGLAALLLLVVLEVETARRLDDGTGGPRLPRGLIAWPLSAMLLTGTTTAGLTVFLVAGYALLRGPRGDLWPWPDSLLTALLASQCALVVLQYGSTTGAGLHQPGGAGAAAILAAVVVCLMVASACTWALAQTHGGVLRTWVMDRLRTRSFYVDELTVLTRAVLVGVVLAVDPWLAVFLAPSFVIAQRASQHAPLREAVDHDPKTGLLTLPAWQHRTARKVDDGRRFAVLLVDLDRFKDVNDRHGHLVGDQVLSQVARALTAGVRPHDLLGRFGGEEFCALLPGADLPDALAVAERLREQVALIRLPEHPQVRVTVSVGVHACDLGGPELVPESLEAADRALYAAKDAGRDRVSHTGRPGAAPADRVVRPRASRKESPNER